MIHSRNILPCYSHTVLTYITQQRFFAATAGYFYDTFNDAVIEAELENINMYSPRRFGYSLIECGKGARMWKLDWTDAYKNVPVAMSVVCIRGRWTP